MNTQIISKKNLENKNIEKWLEENTFYCERLNCRIRKQMCLVLKKRISKQDYLSGKAKLKHGNFEQIPFRPEPCEKCNINIS